MVTWRQACALLPGVYSAGQIVNAVIHHAFDNGVDRVHLKGCVPNEQVMRLLEAVRVNGQDLHGVNIKLVTDRHKKL